MRNQWQQVPSEQQPVHQEPVAVDIRRAIFGDRYNQRDERRPYRAEDARNSSLSTQSCARSDFRRFEFRRLEAFGGVDSTRRAVTGVQSLQTRLNLASI